MCGIAGIFGYHDDSPPVDPGELLRIREWMHMRGPDGSGVWLSGDARIGLAHRRLAIIDLTEAGAQPMHDPATGNVIIFNGEIYNYRELRARLEARGCKFASSSDTEVLLYLYAEMGQDMLRDLRGMYALAIWDQRKQGLFLARDPFGIKPLYLADDGKTLRVASQVKALLAGGQIDTTPEPAGHVGFFLWGHVPEPYTLYKGIRSLPSGSSLWVPRNSHGVANTGDLKPKNFCHLNVELAQASRDGATLDPRRAGVAIRDALRDSVRQHLVADVPVGVFLSAGLDSTMLAAIVAELAPRDLHTVTLGFEEYAGTKNDEVPLAELVAAKLGAKHHTIRVQRRDFEDELPRILQAMDQPSTDGVNSYFVSLAAARAGLKVALSGLGGDELFGSYPSYWQIPRLVGLSRGVAAIPGVGKGLRIASAPFLKLATSPKYAGILEYGGSYGGAFLLRRALYMPWELPSILDTEMVREGLRELQTVSRLDETVTDVSRDHHKVAALEMSWYMRSRLLTDTDWASMAHSLEVRVPFLDLALLRTVAPLLGRPGSPDKRDVAIAVGGLPKEVIDRKKTGFVVPVREWLLGDEVPRGERGLRGWAGEVYRQVPKKFKVLVLVSDAFGGRGGIAKFNRDFLRALCSHPDCEIVVAVPRSMPNEAEEMPNNLRFVTKGIAGKIKYVTTVMSLLSQDMNYDLIVCGHINLIPIAYLCRFWLGAPLALIIHGIDAWQPTKSNLANFLIHKIDCFISVSEFTKKKFIQWSGTDSSKGHILPNCVDPSIYGTGQKNVALLQRYGLEGKRVIMTFGRLVSQERYKGFDEILEILPTIAMEIPDIAYLIVGDGDDRMRLERKVATLGLTERVVFAGYIPDDEKPDHYRLADVYAMPSQGEGFGIVLLEAMACGIPAIASKLDGSSEALAQGRLGTLVDPRKPQEICEAILQALRIEKAIPCGLDSFYLEKFTDRTHRILEDCLQRHSPPCE